MALVSVNASAMLPVDVPTAWNVLSDTQALNVAAGLAPMQLEPHAGPRAARMIGQTTYGGVPTRFYEHPFTWDLHRRFSVRRETLGGPVREILTSWTFTSEAPVDGAPRTRLDIRIDVEVVSVLLSWFTRLQTQRSADALAGAALALVARRDLPQSTETLPPVFEAALSRLLPRVKDPGPARRLAAWLATAEELSVCRFRPYALADAWDMPRRDMLALCLHAVQAGMLELSWELVCPECRNATTALPSLAALDRDEEACPVCEVRFSLDAEGSVEAMLCVTPALRRVERVSFCSGGPRRLAHVVAQEVAPAGGEATLRVPEGIEHLRCVLRGQPSVSVEVVPGGPLEGVAEGESVRVAPGGRLRVRNGTAEDRHVRLQRDDSVVLAATVRDVVTLPGFRTAFSGDTLRPGFRLTIGRVALFFSDLSDSTRLYENVGDAAAFRLVQDHFVLVEEILRRHGGTVVKTIGDAVMAAFVDETTAVAASVAVLEAFEEFRRSDAIRAQTHIKLGVHAGPCYAVNANGILDYFGQSVNLAARLQGLARAGELVVDAALAAHAGALPGVQVSAPEAATLKGVAGAVDVVRVRMRPEAREASA